MRAPASRISRTASSWRGRSSMITITSPIGVPFSLAISASVSPSGRSRSSRWARSLDVGHLLHVDARARVEHRAALGERDHRERVRQARGAAGRCPRAGRRRCRPRAASRRRSARRCRASAPRPSRPRRSRRCRPSGRCRAAGASRRPPRRRPPPSRRGPIQRERRSRRTRSCARARARGCGPASALREMSLMAPDPMENRQRSGFARDWTTRRRWSTTAQRSGRWRWSSPSRGAGRPRPRPLPADEPAGLGPRPHRGLRGPLAVRPRRRAGAAAARPGGASTTPSRRRAPSAATSPTCAATTRSTTWTRCASARSRCSPRDLSPAGPANASGFVWDLLSSTSTSTTRRCSRRSSSPSRGVRARSRGGAAGAALARPRMDACPVAAGRSRSATPATGFAYDNERPRHARRARPRSRSTARRSPTRAYAEFVDDGGYERPRAVDARRAGHWRARGLASARSTGPPTGGVRRFDRGRAARAGRCR